MQEDEYDPGRRKSARGDAGALKKIAYIRDIREYSGSKCLRGYLVNSLGLCLLQEGRVTQLSPRGEADWVSSHSQYRALLHEQSQVYAHFIISMMRCTFKTVRPSSLKSWKCSSRLSM